MRRPVRMDRKSLTLLLVGLMFSLLLPLGALGAARLSVDSVAEGLTCQCGCGLTVANCNHPNCEFSVPVRAQIEAMIAKGQTREQIIRSFRVTYGEKILSAPTTEGFNLVAWLAPFGLVLAGCAGILALCGRWRHHQPANQETAAVATNFAPELRQRLADEIRHDA